MRFWVRELGGWLLIGLGLFAFVLTYVLCDNRRIVEAWPIAIFGIFIFRGGVQLLKVAVAARVCSQVQEQLYQDASPKRR
jgi:hypothetical protein